jgi:uncharacterized protein
MLRHRLGSSTPGLSAILSSLAHTPSRWLALGLTLTLAGCAGSRLQEVGASPAGARALAGGYGPADRVAVLLPSTGPFATGAFGKAVGAIRDGILAAQRADDPAQRPRIDFVDASQVGRTRALIDAGANGGAKYVIGPLQKPAVDLLAAGKGLPVPVLALNRAAGDGRHAANLFQYALAPEDEGLSAAQAAWAAGHRSALLLYPRTPWAERLVQSFRGQWLSLGGQIAAQKAYGSGGTAPDAAVQALLGGREARTGAGGPCVFLVATRESARAIWPRIQAAGGVPTYATSLVYPGDFDPGLDAVLAGLYFVDIPWMLSKDDGPLSRQAVRRTLPGIGGSDQRLYAMGIDAYRLAPRAADLAKRPGSFYPGQTGTLRVDPSGRVQRELVVGQYTPTGVVLTSAGGSPH